MGSDNKKIIFLKPAFISKIWGGNKLKELFDFKIPQNSKIGEAWLVSALTQGMSYVNSGEYKGLSLKELFEEYPALFGFPKTKSYPLLSKIIDAGDNLSVQFHPDNEYAKKYLNSYGKTECWYILDCKRKQNIIYGHNATNKFQLDKWIEKEKWSKLLKYSKIHKGQFIYVPALKVHGILAGTLIFELQQSSDVTYRLYDFDRLDNDGEERTLNIAEAKQLLITPDNNKNEANSHDEYLVDNEFFKLVKITNIATKSYSYPEAKWLQVTVLQGAGKIDNNKIKRGDSFIMTNGYYNFKLSGTLLLMISFC